MRIDRERWLDSSFVKTTPLWFIFEKESFEKGARCNALIAWNAEPLIGSFQPACINEATANSLIDAKNSKMKLIAREFKDDELKSLLSTIVLGGFINVFVYLGTNNVRCFQAIHLLEELER